MKAGTRRGTGALPDDSSKREFVRQMFDRVAPRYDLLNKLMTFGLDSGWRARTITLLALPPGSLVLDLGCGTGDLIAALWRRGFGAVGIDLSQGMLRRARRRAADPLVLGDAVALPFDTGTFDGAVSGFALRNLVDLGPVVAELSRVVRPGGRLSLLEVAEPEHPAMAAGRSLWFGHGVPALGALLSDADAYRYLPQSISYLPSETELAAILVDAGFGEARRQTFSGGIVQIVTATRRGGQTFRRRAS